MKRGMMILLIRKKKKSKWRVKFILIKKKARILPMNSRMRTRKVERTRSKKF